MRHYLSLLTSEIRLVSDFEAFQSWKTRNPADLSRALNAVVTQDLFDLELPLGFADNINASTVWWVVLRGKRDDQDMVVGSAWVNQAGTQEVRLYLALLQEYQGQGIGMRSSDLLLKWVYQKYSRTFELVFWTHPGDVFAEKLRRKQGSVESHRIQIRDSLSFSGSNVTRNQMASSGLA